MGVYKRKDSSYWWYNLSVKGKRYQISTKLKYTRDNKKHAEKMYYEHYDRITRLGHEERSWEDLINRLYQQYGKEDQNNLTKLSRFFADKKLHEITRDLISGAIDFYALNRKASTVNRVFNSLRSALNKAYKELGWITTLPYVKKLKEEQFMAKILSIEEEKRLLAALPDYLKAIVRFTLLTGLRQSTVLNITWDMLDWENKKINIPAKFMKNGQPHSLPLRVEAWQIIAQQDVKGIYPQIFKFEGRPIKNPTAAAWRTALKKSGITNFRFHDLRHTWTTRMIESGASIDTVSYLGGWSNHQMVSRYSKQRQIDVSGIEGYE